MTFYKLAIVTLYRFPFWRNPFPFLSVIHNADRFVTDSIIDCRPPRQLSTRPCPALSVSGSERVYGNYADGGPNTVIEHYRCLYESHTKIKKV
jgi:hypothetical protein